MLLNTHFPIQTSRPRQHEGFEPRHIQASVHGGSLVILRFDRNYASHELATMTISLSEWTKTAPLKKVFNAQPIGTGRKGRPNLRRIDGLENIA
ncbi:hypothetical protein TNCV_1144701 [Trichonephila clavipes]|nr:hypothetical protein TNCV_1144701 [Trichonephila clavipes]